MVASGQSPPAASSSSRKCELCDETAAKFQLVFTSAPCDHCFCLTHIKQLVNSFVVDDALQCPVCSFISDLGGEAGVDPDVLENSMKALVEREMHLARLKSEQEAVRSRLTASLAEVDKEIHSITTEKQDLHMLQNAVRVVAGLSSVPAASPPPASEKPDGKSPSPAPEKKEPSPTAILLKNLEGRGSFRSEPSLMRSDSVVSRRSSTTSLGDRRLSSNFDMLKSSASAVNVLEGVSDIFDDGDSDKVLHMTLSLREGRNITDMKGKRCDPYVIPKLGNHTKWRTKTVKRNRDPVWNETTEFTGGFNYGSTLVLHVMDWEAIGDDDPIGWVTIPIEAGSGPVSHSGWYRIHRGKGVVSETIEGASMDELIAQEKASKEHPTGFISLKMTIIELDKSDIKSDKVAGEKGSNGGAPAESTTGDERIDILLEYIETQDWMSPENSALFENLQAFHDAMMECADDAAFRAMCGEAKAWTKVIMLLCWRLGGMPALAAYQCLGLAIMQELARCEWIWAPQSRESATQVARALLQSEDEQVMNEAAMLLLGITGRDDLSADADLPMMQALVSLLRSGERALHEKATMALWVMSTNNHNRILFKDTDGLPALIPLLQGADTDISEHAIIALGYLTRNDDIKSMMSRYDAFPPLLEVLRGAASDTAKAKAAGVLWNCASDADNRTVLRDYGAIETLSSLLGSPDSSLQENAAGALWNMAVDGANKTVIRECNGLQALISLLTSEHDRVLENVSGALWNCSANPENRVAMRKLGAIEPLLVLMYSPNEVVQDNVTGTVRNLAINDQNKIVLRELGGIGTLVSLCDHSSTSLLEKAASTLWICSINNENKDTIRECGGIPKLVALVSHKSDNIVEKAAGCLRSLSTSRANRDAMLGDAVSALISAASARPSPVKEHAAATLRNMAKMDEACVQIQELGGTLAMISCLKDPSEEVQLQALGALHNIAMNNNEHRDMLRKIGGLQPIVYLLQSKNVEVAETAVAAVRVCSTGVENAIYLRRLNTIPKLLPLLGGFEGPAQLADVALCLKHLATHNDEARMAIGVKGMNDLLGLLSREDACKSAAAAIVVLCRNEDNRSVVDEWLGEFVRFSRMAYTNTNTATHADSRAKALITAAANEQKHSLTPSRTNPAALQPPPTEYL